MYVYIILLNNYFDIIILGAGVGLIYLFDDLSPFQCNHVEVLLRSSSCIVFSPFIVVKQSSISNKYHTEIESFLPCIGS